MDNPSLLLTAMARECREQLLRSHQRNLALPASIRSQHLQWMCDKIELHAEDWPATKLHRWIGFIQAAMIANRMLDLHQVKTMFNDLKNAYGELSEDLTDHLDPANSYEVDIGGEG